MQEKIGIQLKELQERLEAIKAKDIMTTNVITASENMSLADVADFMLQKRISGLPVTSDNGQLVGIITTTDLFTLLDIVRLGSIKDNALNPKVRFAMSTHIISITPETTLDEMITLAKQHNIHTLPVCEKGKLIGIIGRRDILKKFYDVTRDIARG